MLTDVLAALRRSQRVDLIVVVTREHARRSARPRHGARTIRDPDEPGHSPAAARWRARGRGARAPPRPPRRRATARRSTRPRSTTLLARPHGDARVVIVPDRHGTGRTRCCWRRPTRSRRASGPAAASATRLAREAGGAPVESPSRRRSCSTSTRPRTSRRCAPRSTRAPRRRRPHARAARSARWRARGEPC